MCIVHHAAKVEIAFSSISFENWILLHYEKNLIQFEKSECKHPRPRKDYIECQKLVSLTEKIIGCEGERCVGGYMRRKGYAAGENTKSKESVFPTLKKAESLAYINAAWQRFEVEKRNPGVTFYRLNPFTNLDLMLQIIRKHDYRYFWFDLTDNLTCLGKQFIFTKKTLELSIKIKNVSKANMCLIPEEIAVQNLIHDSLTIGENKILPPNESHEILYKLKKDDHYLALSLNGRKLYCKL